MRTLVVGEHPELEALLDRRRALGQDGMDEVWEGVYVVAPYAHSRHGIVEDELRGALFPRAKAAELVVADPDARTVRCWHLIGGAYVERETSALLDVTTAQLVAEVDWPD